MQQTDAVSAENWYGDGINIAARLEGLCEPGGICISSKVYEEIKGRFEIDYVDIGDQNLRNIADPVRVFRINLAGALRRKQPSHVRAWENRRWLMATLAVVSYKVARIWQKWLSRRGSRFPWDRFTDLLKRHPLPAARIVHRYTAVSETLP
jgi:hypothetical protein